MMKQVVDYQGIQVGVLIPRGGSLAFMAVKYDVIELDGRSFSSATEAREAVRNHVAQRMDLARKTGFSSERTFASLHLQAGRAKEIAC
jgi:hypothetical protein